MQFSVLLRKQMDSVSDSYEYDVGIWGITGYQSAHVMAMYAMYRHVQSGDHRDAQRLQRCFGGPSESQAATSSISIVLGD